jgi:LSD1 subclass zinc finger protein
MTDTPKIRSMDCPSCGAPLEFVEGQTVIKCKYCGDVIERPQAKETEAPQTPQPTVVVHQISVRRNLRPRLSPAQAGAASRAVGCFIFGPIILVVLFVIGVVALAEVGLPAALKGPLQQIVPIDLVTYEAALLVPSVADAPSDVVVFTYDISDQTHALAKVEGASHRMVWRAASFGEDVFLYPGSMIAEADVLYVAAEDRLVAINLGDGSTLWETPLTDALHPSCGTCLQVFGEFLVALTTDSVVQGFDAKTGQQLWSHPLERIIYTLYRIADQPVVFDEDETGASLFFFDPATGAVTRRLTPACTYNDGRSTDELDSDSPVIFDQVNQALYLVFGSPETCVQRWAAAGDVPAWDTHLTSEDGFSSAYNLWPLLTHEAVYLGTENGRLWSFDVATGAMRQLLSEEDTQFILLAEQDGVLLMRALNTRGTRKYALWGVEAATGNVLWKHSFDEAEPLEEPGRSVGLLTEGDSAWAIRPVAEGVMILSAQVGPNQLTVETLNYSGGSSTDQKVVKLPGTSEFYSVPTVIGWRGNRVWLNLDSHIYSVDIDSATVEYTWP